ncbi:MAG TPA: transketolase [Fimbriimonadaceae bacterium]|nr:transketolase [Fimbriimonadaceae bacterium]
MVPSRASTDLACINTIRGLSIDAVQRANSGHPGMPLGTAAMAFALWDRHLKHCPSDPKWFDRDRFVLSAGHGSMLLYSLLYLYGYGLELDDIKQFRQWGSRTPGHPENNLTPGVEMATGPLGQGISTAVGMAMAERFLGARFNTPGSEVVDHFTYVIASDGDLMEGVAQEACSLAGHQGLGRLIVLYDSNRITIDGSTELTFTDDTAAKFQAVGWHVQSVDGLDVDAVDAAISKAKQVDDRPSLIVCRTVIGYGSPHKAGTALSHGSALGKEEVALTKQALGIPEEDFYVDPEALSYCRRAVKRGDELKADWEARIEAYTSANLAMGQEFKDIASGRLPACGDLPAFADPIATRNASHKALNAVAQRVPTFVSGCADLAGSVKTTIKDGGEMQPGSPCGRNISFSVREHAMAAAVNGMTLHGGMRAAGGTFLIFSDYCRPSLRLAALMECPSIFLFSHDSIGLGEDGPTHQPIEQTMSLRMIPNFNVMRPADGNETSVCWRIAMQSKSTPSAILLTRQDVPPVSPSPEPGHPAERGAYVVSRANGDECGCLVATGSEVSLALESQSALAKQGKHVRVVSMPSWFLFESQDEGYKKSVLPTDLPTVSIEAGTTLGWSRYARAHVGIDRFGASAPAERLFQEFGFTVENVVRTMLSLL